MNKPETIKIDDVEYVRKTDKQESADALNGLEYVIIRTRSAGVFAGYLKSKTGMDTVLLQVRRLWYWSGAASLSQMAVDGTSKPKDCKFPEIVSKIELSETLEVLSVTKKAKQSIDSVPVWKV